MFPTHGQHLQNKWQINKRKNTKKINKQNKKKQKFSKSNKTTFQQEMEHKNTQERTNNKKWSKQN